jgi:hypothetical protein
MSIFRCTKCGVIDNTAVSGYWSWVHHYPEGATDVKEMVKRPPLCSECNPEIGKWHGRFPKMTPESEGLVEGPDGFLYHPDDKYLKELRARHEEKKERDHGHH